MDEHIPITPPEGRQAPQPAPQPKRNSPLAVAAVVLSGLAVVLAGTALYLVLRRSPAPPEPATIQFAGQTLEVVEGLAEAPYDRDCFSLDERGRVVYEKDGKRARTGIDVSTYQGEIDWQAVAGDGIDFAILRLGYRGYTAGGLMMDQRFEENIRGAAQAGLDVGIYFFSQAITPQEAQAEAAFVLNAIQGHEVSYPIAFDWEPITSTDQARTQGLDGAVLTACAAAFCQEIERAGYQSAVYFNQEQGYLHYDLGELDGHLMWLAEYDQAPDFYYHFDLWQYGHTGQVAGIQGEVDLDLDLRGVV